jgi:hypothetical protein
VDSTAHQPTLSADQLHNWRLVERFQQTLKPLVERYKQGSFSDTERLLELGDYLSLFLFGLFNPCVRTMRGLCEISRLKQVQEEVCRRAVSLGSFSEAQHVLDLQLLEEVFGQLSQAVPPQAHDARLGQWQWLARDGSLFAALPRMHWALYGGGKVGTAKAVRLHLSLNILEDKPQVAAVRPGKICERKVWREHWQKGQAYVGDRLFGQDYRAFGQLEALGSVYVLRVREQQATIQVEQELALSAEDQQAGVIRQAWGRLGCRKRHQSVRLRLVWVKTRENNLVILATNLPEEKLAAHLVWLLYKSRWKVELFFRWIKCILGCRHWLAESANGVAIQVYLALIAALLLQLHFGRRPNKRMMELIQFHQLGIATDQELQAGLQRQLKQIEQRKKA